MKTGGGAAAVPESPGARYQHLLARHLGELGPEAGRRISEVLAFTDFAAALTRPRRAEEVAALILLVALGETGARWTGLLRPDGNGALRPAGRRGAADPAWPELAVALPAALPEAAVVRSGDCPPDSGEPEAPWCSLLETASADAAALLRFDDRLLGVLLVGARRPEIAGSKSDFLEALAAAAGAALEGCRRDEELRLANRRLSLNVYQLQSLMDLTTGFHRATDETGVWDLLLNGAMGHVLASRAAVVAGGRVLAARGPRRPDEDWSALLRAAAAVGPGAGVLPVAELEDRSLAAGLAQLEIGWVAPFSCGSFRGALFVGAGSVDDAALSPASRSFLGSLAAQAAAAVDSLRLTRAAIEKEKELEAARRIQSRFLPDRPPRPAGWDIGGVNIPCLAVGGDYYDYLDLRGGIFLTIADVAGKGPGPALIMASVQASLRAFFFHGHTEIAGAALELNQLLHDNTAENRYMTAVLARFEPETGRFDYLNAGHVRPLLLRSGGKVERLDRGSTVLGLFREIEVETGRFTLEPGDLLILFTDGLSETESPEGELFEEERLVEALDAARDKSARDICGELVSRARAFAGSRPLADDLTLIVLKRTA